jgi:LNS2 (Lipin/Ned1/Smp2)
MDFYYVNAHEFKYNTLQKYVIKPFVEIGADMRSILYAGFGNTLYDMHAYHHAGIDLYRMFIIDKKSRIHCCDATLTSLPGNKGENDDSMKQQAKCQLVLDHPKQYESVKGSMFANGYKDPNLISYIMNLNQR